MLYPFITLPDETEIVHSECIWDGDKERVKVCIEKPVDYGFKSATCWLPEYRRENVDGYSETELGELLELIQSLAAPHISLTHPRFG